MSFDDGSHNEADLDLLLLYDAMLSPPLIQYMLWLMQILASAITELLEE